MLAYQKSNAGDMSRSLAITGNAIVTMPDSRELIVVTPAIIVIMKAVVAFSSTTAGDESIAIFCSDNISLFVTK